MSDNLTASGKIMKDKHVRRWTEQFSEQMEVRLDKRKKLEESGSNPYKNGLKPNTTFEYLVREYGHKAKEEIGETPRFKVAGRVLMVRDFGKAAFLQCDDGTQRFQLYMNKQQTSEKGFAEYGLLDFGDIVYAEGDVLKTMKGELALNVREFSILTKSIRPLPEKFHGLQDKELRYRKRYLDMIMNADVRKTFKIRSKIVSEIRHFFEERDFLEVETPMMHPIAGGANAKPFVTHHNALGVDRYLRIAPELYLKRLVVGGFEAVFEINRNFRNEGMDQTHNPEFTMIEFYWAYHNYHDLMHLTEEMFDVLLKKLKLPRKLPQ
jgi:lysyl-tRNA synthetase class 2